MLSVLLLAPVASGCGNDNPPPPPAPSAKPVTPTSASAPVASASAPASASASAIAIPIPSVAAPQGPVKWADFSGPEMKPSVKEGQRAWAALPVSAGWDTLKLAMNSVSRLDDSTVIFSIGGVDYYVPAAFCVPAEAPKDLSVGAAVMASAFDTRVYGRVVSVGALIKVKFRFATSVEERDFEPSDVVKLDGTPKFGAPVVYREPKEGTRAKDLKLRAGAFVEADDAKTWLLGFNGKPTRLPSEDVHAMDVQTHRVGDKVLVARQEEVVAGLVEEVQEDGIRYRIKLENGEEATATLDAVSGEVPGMAPPAPSSSASPGPPPPH